MSITTVFLLLLMLFFPLLSLRAQQSGKLPAFLSPVILCYGIGIIVANTGLISDSFHLAERVSEGSILLAIPFLLFATDLIGWFKFAKSTLISFALIVFSGLVCSLLAAWLWGEQIDNTAQLSGMLTGLYTGGIPNMNAIGKALSASPELLIYLNAADIVTGGLYLVFLTSFAPFLYGKILKKSSTSTIMDRQQSIKTPFQIKVFLAAFLLTLLILGASIGLTFMLTGELKSVSIILLSLTTLSIIASLIPSVRAWEGTFEIGEYFILIFCVAIGLSANFSNVPAEGTLVILYTATVLISTVVLHLILCKIFKIDRDTMMITSVAALYGPPFVGQMASVINNRTLIVSGMATGLVGYAIGNYLGILVAQVAAVL